MSWDLCEQRMTCLQNSADLDVPTRKPGKNVSVSWTGGFCLTTESNDIQRSWQIHIGRYPAMSLSMIAIGLFGNHLKTSFFFSLVKCFHKTEISEDGQMAMFKDQGFAGGLVLQYNNRWIECGTTTTAAATATTAAATATTAAAATATTAAATTTIQMVLVGVTSNI